MIPENDIWDRPLAIITNWKKKKTKRLKLFNQIFIYIKKCKNYCYQPMSSGPPPFGCFEFVCDGVNGMWWKNTWDFWMVFYRENWGIWEGFWVKIKIDILWLRGLIDKTYSHI